MNRLDLSAIITISIAILLLVIVIAIGNPTPLQVTCITSGGCAQVSPFAAISLQFSRPVDQQQVEKKWTTTPQMAGRWSWQDNRHATWKANQPLSAGEQISFNLANGVIGKNDEKIPQALQWSAEIREPKVIFKLGSEKGAELFTLPITTDSAKKPEQLTHTNGKLFDYAVSKDGEQIAFSVMNEKNGVDIWVIDRDGNEEKKLIDCGTDSCTAPSWSPISNEIAYNRESAGLDPNGPKGAPRIWIMNLDTLETNPLFKDPQKVGYGANWSPDGQWISYWAGAQGGIQITNRGKGDTILLKTQSGDSGCWSADSRFLYFSDIINSSEATRNIIQKADLVDGTTSLSLGTISGDYTYGFTMPACHPLKNLLAVAVQKNNTYLNSEIDVLSPVSQGGQYIIDDPTRVFDSFSWSPDGTYLVFQASRQGGKEGDTEVWAWSSPLNKTWMLLDGAKIPKVLP